MDASILSQAESAAPEKSQLDVSLPQAVRSLCTPEQHAKTNKAKPVLLLELVAGPHGKTALLEFPEGWQRTIELTCQADAWHPLFSELSKEDAKRLRECVEHPIVRHADGRRTRQGELPFFTEELNRLGGWKSTNYFDVPAQEYTAGWVTGYRCAAELLETLQRGYGPRINAIDVIKAAIQASDDTFGKPGRRGAACAFLEVMVQGVNFMAKHGQNQPYLARKIEGAEQQRDYWANRETERKSERRAEFVERMKAGKAAKRTTKETEAA